MLETRIYSEKELVELLGTPAFIKSQLYELMPRLI